MVADLPLGSPGQNQQVQKGFGRTQEKFRHVGQQSERIAYQTIPGANLCKEVNNTGYRPC